MSEPPPTARLSQIGYGRFCFHDEIILYRELEPKNRLFGLIFLETKGNYSEKQKIYGTDHMCLML